MLLNLLDIKDSTTSSLKFHSLKALAEEFRDQWNDRYSGRIRVEVLSDAKVLVDLEHLKQVYKNLLLNALNYSKENSPVLMKVDGSTLIFENEGDAIPLEVLARLGTPFNRGSTHTRGTGLGLAWIHTLAKIYNWKLVFHYANGRQYAQLSF